MKRYFLVLVALAPLLLRADLPADGEHWWKHVQVLADDSMEGRLAGSPGHLRAAQYVAGQFEQAGLQPGVGTQYLQPVLLQSHLVNESRTSVALEHEGKAEPLALGGDVVVGARGDTKIEAPMIFVGYGLKVSELKYDDLAGLDLKGKVIVMLSGGPASMPGALRAHFSSLGERWPFLRQMGVVGLVSIPNPKSMDIPWERAALARFQPAMVYRDTELNEARDLQFTATVNPASAGKLLAGSGHELAELLRLADAGQPLPRFPLTGRIRAQVTVEMAPVESQNVVGVLPGHDPKLKDEFVILSAHLDHLGVGAPINGDKVYNGAMDDASGIATLVEIARHLHQQQTPLKRSVAFVAVTGEEKGLLGSRYFSKRPTMDRKKIVADLNFDMFLPLHPLKLMMVLGLDESTLGPQIRAAAGEQGVQVQADPEPERRRFVRSDQYSFIREGVPALAFKFGYEKGSPEEALHKAWTHDRYHAPSDDLAQPVDKAAAAKFNQILSGLVVRVANDPQRPEWKQESFFRRFAQ